MRPLTSRWLTAPSGLCRVLIVSTTAALPAAVGGQEIVVHLGESSSVSVMPGADLVLPVIVDMSGAEGRDLAGLDFQLHWNPAAFSFEAAVAGGFGSVTLNESGTSTGALSGGLFSASGTTETFTALELTLQAGATEGLALVSVSVGVAGDELGESLMDILITRSTTVCIATLGLLGDVTGDGVVNIIDAQQVARASVGLAVSPAVQERLLDFGDVTGDGTVNIIDAQQIARFSVGLEVEFQIGVAISGGCSDNGPDVPPITEGDWYRPGVSTTWQWQLQGAITTTYDVDLYEIDLFEAPTAVIEALQVSGKRVLCYFSAGSWEDFRPDAGSFPSAVLGAVYAGFEDERWLDIRSEVVLNLMKSRLDLAVQRGCDGVEADNVDGFDNPSGFPLTASDQLRFNRRIFNEAHVRGLAVALKNDVGQVAELIDYVDLSVNERCHEEAECGQLAPFPAAGKPVLNAEYAEIYMTSGTARDQLCAAALEMNFRTLVLSAELDDSFRFSCDGN